METKVLMALNRYDLVWIAFLPFHEDASLVADLFSYEFCYFIFLSLFLFPFHLATNYPQVDIGPTLVPIFFPDVTPILICNLAFDGTTTLEPGLERAPVRNGNCFFKRHISTKSTTLPSPLKHEPNHFVFTHET